MTGLPWARSRVMREYSSWAMSAVSSMRTLRTSCPSGPVWWVTSCMPRIWPAHLAGLLGRLGELDAAALAAAAGVDLGLDDAPAAELLADLAPPPRRSPSPCPWGSRPHSGAGSPWPDTRGSSRRSPPTSERSLGTWIRDWGLPARARPPGKPGAGGVYQRGRGAPERSPGCGGHTPRCPWICRVVQGYVAKSPDMSRSPRICREVPGYVALSPDMSRSLQICRVAWGYVAKSLDMSRSPGTCREVSGYVALSADMSRNLGICREVPGHVAKLRRRR